mgnify:CR=1 FL=1
MFEVLFENSLLQISTGLLAKNTHGSVLVSYEGATILCTATVGEWSEYSSCLPLSVVYQERAYAIKRIPAGFIKREGRSKEHEIAIARFIDRALRPTISKSFRYEIQIVCTVINYDKKHVPTSTMSIVGASAALLMAGVPSVAVGAVAIGYKSGNWSLYDEKCSHYLFIAGHSYGVTALENHGEPISTSALNKGFQYATSFLHDSSQLVRKVASAAKKITWNPVAIEQHDTECNARELVDNYKSKNYEAIEKQKQQFLLPWKNRKLGEFRWNQVVRSIMRQFILWNNIRIDLREFDDIRKISIESIAMKQPHCVFTRGSTQVLSVATMASNDECQIVETLDGVFREKFITHYMFHPYSTAEVGRCDGSSRREIGHGCLVQKALRFSVKDSKMIRIVSEVLESDGSSSMASVCASSIALQKLEVGIRDRVAGISIGLLTENAQTIFLTDLTACEDDWSDMDLKLAGTSKGITALQLDIKIAHLPWQVLFSGVEYGFDKLKRVLKICFDEKNNKEENIFKNDVHFKKNDTIKDNNDNVVDIDDVVRSKNRKTAYEDRGNLSENIKIHSSKHYTPNSDKFSQVNLEKTETKESSNNKKNERKHNTELIMLHNKSNFKSELNKENLVEKNEILESNSSLADMTTYFISMSNKKMSDANWKKITPQNNSEIKIKDNGVLIKAKKSEFIKIGNDIFNKVYGESKKDVNQAEVTSIQDRKVKFKILATKAEGSMTIKEGGLPSIGSIIIVYKGSFGRWRYLF